MAYVEKIRITYEILVTSLKGEITCNIQEWGEDCIEVDVKERRDGGVNQTHLAENRDWWLLRR